MADRVKQYIDYAFDKLEGMEITIYCGYQKSRYTRNIHISEGTREKADEIYKKLRGDVFMSVRNPRTTAAGIVYIACFYVFNKPRITQKHVADALGIKTTETVQKSYLRITRQLHLIYTGEYPQKEDFVYLGLE